MKKFSDLTQVSRGVTQVFPGISRVDFCISVKPGVSHEKTSFISPCVNHVNHM